MQIKEITAKETHHVRHLVLRQNQPLSACIYPHDEDDFTLHLGVFIQSDLASIVSFYKEVSPDISAKSQYRFRGMATLPDHRSKGYGSALLAYGENILKERNVEIVWCNARVSALPFYLKLNYTDLPHIFDIPGIGPHKVMFKKINEVS